MKECSQPHLGEGVEPVVAGCAVSPERYVDAGVQQLGHMRQAAAQLQVAGGAVQDPGARLRQQLDFSRGEVNAVGQQDIWPAEAERVRLEDERRRAEAAAELRETEAAATARIEELRAAEQAARDRATEEASQRAADEKRAREEATEKLRRAEEAAAREEQEQARRDASVESRRRYAQTQQAGRNHAKEL